MSFFDSIINKINSDNINCNNVKDIVSKNKNIDIAKSGAILFNKNIDIFNNSSMAFCNSINNMKCYLNEVNNQILTNPNDEKFNVNEIDNLKNNMIQRLGGVTNKKYILTIIIFIISLVVIIVISKLNKF